MPSLMGRNPVETGRRPFSRLKRVVESPLTAAVSAAALTVTLQGPPRPIEKADASEIVLISDQGYDRVICNPASSGNSIPVQVGHEYRVYDYRFAWPQIGTAAISPDGLDVVSTNDFVDAKRNTLRGKAANGTLVTDKLNYSPRNSRLTCVS